MFTVQISSSLRALPRDEDGVEGAVEVFFVTVENSKGVRWAHNKTFGIEHNGLKTAEKFCRKIQKHLDKGGKLNPQHWSRYHSVYGSVAYIEGNEELDLKALD